MRRIQLGGDLAVCPKCKFKFSTTYARASACKGCYVLTVSPTCDYIKCPRCGHEFPTV